MNSIKLLISVFSIMLFTVIALHAQASDRNEFLVKQLQERDQQIKALLQGHDGNTVEGELKVKLTKLINETIDFKEMGKMALGKKIDNFTAEELDEFYDLFSKMVRENSIKNLDIYKASITYEEVKESDDQVIVQTVSSLDNVSTPVYYTFLNVNDSWVVADFAIDNVSTAMSYRRTFSQLIGKRGVEGLLNVLRKRVSSED